MASSLRVLVVWLVVWLVAQGLVGAQDSAAPAKADFGPRPNIVIIYTDDQGYGDVGALNPDAKFATPNIDRLVRRRQDLQR